jgi:hypothetical protein
MNKHHLSIVTRCCWQPCSQRKLSMNVKRFLMVYTCRRGLLLSRTQGRHWNEFWLMSCEDNFTSNWQFLWRLRFYPDWISQKREKWKKNSGNHTRKWICMQISVGELTSRVLSGGNCSSPASRAFFRSRESSLSLAILLFDAESRMIDPCMLPLSTFWDSFGHGQ